MKSVRSIEALLIPRHWHCNILYIDKKTKRNKKKKNSSPIETHGAAAGGGAETCRPWFGSKKSKKAVPFTL